jgi:hypothetical protein
VAKVVYSLSRSKALVQAPVLPKKIKDEILLPGKFNSLQNSHFEDLDKYYKDVLIF